MNGGWFTLEMKVDPAAANDLVVTYWGNERSRPEFEIQVDGQKVADETLADRPNNRFYDVTYPLPEAMTKGKQKVVVKFQAKERKSGGSVSGARVVRRAPL